MFKNLITNSRPIKSKSLSHLFTCLFELVSIKSFKFIALDLVRYATLRFVIAWLKLSILFRLMKDKTKSNHLTCSHAFLSLGAFASCSAWSICASDRLKGEGISFQPIRRTT